MPIYGKDINPNRGNRTGFAFKSPRIHRRVLVEQGPIKPGEKLMISFGKIEHEPHVPGSLHLTFKAKPVSSTDKSAYFVQNLGRALVVEKDILFNGKRSKSEVSIDEYNMYKDCWLHEDERKKMFLQGIQDELGLKYRIDAKKAAAGGELENVTDKHKALKLAYGNTFKISLDDELFTDNAGFYPYALNDKVTIELKLADAKDVVISTDTSASYDISNVYLEWDAIQSPTLGREISAMYSEMGIYYDRIHFLRKESKNKSDTMININVRESLSSLRGVLVMFKDVANHQKKYAMTREKWYNPKIEEVKIAINSSANQLYANGLLPKDLYYEATKFFGEGVSQGDFYNDKFCLWIDTRSSTDPALHGNGMVLDGSNTGIDIAIQKTAEAAGPLVMYIFLVIDAVMEFQNASYSKVCYALNSCPTGDGDM